MNLYLISQSANNDYDTYDSAVVCATDEESARKIHPKGRQTEGWGDNEKVWWESTYKYRSWASKLDQVTVRLIGSAAESVAEGVVCASFNAG
jgi:hypothetical protein